MSDPSPPQTLFATTRWTLIREAALGGDTVATEALGALFRTYWQPFYRYARRKGKSKKDAEDLVLGSMLQLTEGALRVAVHRLRKRYRHLLIAEVSRTLASPDFVEDEMLALHAAISS